MTIIGLLLFLFILGFICWAIQTAPMINKWFKSVIIGVIVIVAVIGILQSFGFATGTPLLKFW